MCGPRTPTEARSWIREAVAATRYVQAVHFRERLAERKVTMLDVLHILQRGPRIEPYPDQGAHGGTCRRVIGRDLDGERSLGVGVEAFMGDDGKAALLVTVMEVRR